MTHLLVVDDWGVDRLRTGALLESGTNYFVRYACDGLEALEQIEAALPLVVVSDLQMPNLDGMQLVEAIRQRYPHVPTIVVTAYGSEDIAVRALLAGAADYVPKSRLATDLIPAVKGLLEIAAGDRLHHRAADCLQYQEIHYELDNDLLLGAAVIDQFRQIATLLSLVDPTDAIRLARALMEALRNAIYHGNLELPPEAAAAGASPDVLAQRRVQSPYCDRRVLLRAEFRRDQATFTVRDHGAGFDVARLLPDVAAQPSQLNDLEGRGLVLIRLFMDEVNFNATGNEIRMTKRRRA